MKDFNPDAFFRKLMTSVKGLDEVDIKYLFSSLYNTTTGMFNHRDVANDARHPFAVIKAFPDEDPLVDSLMEDLAVRYTENKIWERYKLTFSEYTSLPMFRARQLDKIAEKVIRPIEEREQKKQAQATAEQINNITGGQTKK